MRFTSQRIFTRFVVTTPVRYYQDKFLVDGKYPKMDSTMIIDPYTWHRLRIDSISLVSTDTLAVRMKRPADYQFRAGQYAVVRVTTDTRTAVIRQYSFSSAPQDEMLELLIQREPEGIVSTWAHESARVGDEIELSQPLGSFTLPPRLDRPILCIAGRVGITPFISMLRDKTRQPINVIYSVRSRDQVCFPELLEAHHATIIQTDISPRLSKEFLQKSLEAKPVVYVCGSKQFVESITAALYRLDVPTPDIKRELFTLQ